MKTELHPQIFGAEVIMSQFFIFLRSTLLSRLVPSSRLDMGEAVGVTWGVWVGEACVSSLMQDCWLARCFMSWSTCYLAPASSSWAFINCDLVSTCVDIFLSISIICTWLSLIIQREYFATVWACPNYVTGGGESYSSSSNIFSRKESYMM